MLLEEAQERLSNLVGPHGRIGLPVPEAESYPRVTCGAGGPGPAGAAPESGGLEALDQVVVGTVGVFAEQVLGFHVVVLGAVFPFEIRPSGVGGRPDAAETGARSRPGW